MARVKGGAFIHKGELATELGVDLKTIDSKIAAGIIPPPHSRLGPRITLWRRRDYLKFHEDGVWPPESFKVGR